MRAENEPEQAQGTQPKPKPPPIYIREKISNPWSTKLLRFCAFHVTKGDVHETKLQTKSETWRKLEKATTRTM